MPDPVAKVVTYDEYLAREATSVEKLEYLRGEIHAMSGGSPDHCGVAAAVIGALVVSLAGRPCRVFTSDLKIRVDETDLSTYPDVSVICGALETSPRDANAAINPVVVVEVLSPATEAYDRGAKFGHYRRLRSLQEMVFVDPGSHTVEVHRRNAAGRFELYVFEPGDELELASLGVKLQVDALYANPLRTG